MTYDELHAEMVAAMKAKDKVRLSVTRVVLGELKNVATRGAAHDITEEEVTTQVKRTLKQTLETLEMSEKAGNNAERTENLRALVPMPKRANGAMRRVRWRVGAVPARRRGGAARRRGVLAGCPPSRVFSNN